VRQPAAVIQTFDSFGIIIRTTNIVDSWVEEDVNIWGGPVALVKIRLGMQISKLDWAIT
jgi:hypothetical protein